jgi:hypothetical protein
VRRRRPAPAGLLTIGTRRLFVTHRSTRAGLGLVPAQVPSPLPGPPRRGRGGPVSVSSLPPAPMACWWCRNGSPWRHVCAIMAAWTSRSSSPPPVTPSPTTRTTPSRKKANDRPLLCRRRFGNDAAAQPEARALPLAVRCPAMTASAVVVPVMMPPLRNRLFGGGGAMPRPASS